MQQLAKLSDRKLYASLFAFALVLRFAYLFEVKDTPFFHVLLGDAFSYDAWALAIQNDWIGTEAFYQAPLYPYFLALVFTVFGHSLLIVRVIQVVLGALSVVLLTAAGRVFFSRTVGLVAGLLLAVYGPALFFDGLIQKASLDLFFTAAVLCCLANAGDSLRARWLAWAGVALGCLSLTRENALALFPLVILWLIWLIRRRRPAIWGKGAIWNTLRPFVLGWALVLGPVALRNWVVAGEIFVTSSQLGVNFFNGNNANADGEYTPLRFGRGSFAQEREDAIELAAQASGHELTPGEVSSFWLGQAWDWISSHPGDWLKLLVRKWFLVWSNHEVPDSDQPIVYQDASCLLTATTTLVSFGTIFPLALVGLIASWGDRRRIGILHLLLLGAAASTAVFYVCARYRMPMVPILCLFAAVGFAQIVSLLRERKIKQLMACLSMVLVLGALTRLQTGEDEHPRAVAHYNLALSLEAQGQVASAAANYRQAVADNPDFVEAHVNLGALLARDGQFEQAMAEERAALRLKADDANAHTILANALLESGQFGDAEQHYRAALALEPGLVSAREGLLLLQQLKARSQSR